MFNCIKYVFLTVFLFAASCTFESHQNLCGNGTKEPGEECDGNPVVDTTCTLLGFSGGTLSCKSDCTFDLSSCDGYISTCGNNIMDPGEECDGVAVGTLSCEDLGYRSGNLSCTRACTLDTSQCTQCVDSCRTGEKRCADNTIYNCEFNSDSGCYEWFPSEDCSVNNQFCAETAYGDVYCSSNCTESCQKGDSRCSLDNLSVETCEEIDGGCLAWISTSCEEGFVCSEESGIAGCVDLNPCVSDCNPGIRLKKCSDDGLSVMTCGRAEEDCYKWETYENCDSDQICWSVVENCVAQRRGISCNEAVYAVSDLFVKDGTDFSTEFPVDPGSPVSCVSGSGGRIYFVAHMNAGDVKKFSSTPAGAFSLGVIADCSDESVCISLSSEALYFQADTDGTFVFTAVADSTSVTAYSFTLASIPVLNEGDFCLPDGNAGVCAAGLFCGLDANSPFGTSCIAVQSGNDCLSAVNATSGDNYGMLQGLTDNISSSGATGSVEQIWKYTPTESGTYLLSMRDFSYSKNLYVRTACSDATDLYFVSGDGFNDADLVVSMNSGMSYFIICEKVYPFLSDVNPYSYTLRIMKVENEENTLCGDGLDNDMDGLADCDDPGCFGNTSFCATETNCSDGSDNDVDGDMDCDDNDCFLDEHCIVKRGIYQVFDASDPNDTDGYGLLFTPDDPFSYTLSVTDDATVQYPSSSYSSDFRSVSDDRIYVFHLPFTFNFYGFDYSDVYVSSNGWMSFAPQTESYPFEDVNTLFSNPFIAVMWDDLNRVNSGDNFTILWGEEDQTSVKWWSFIFYSREYNAVDHILHAQVILFEDGRIAINYITNLVSDGIAGIASNGHDPIPPETDLIP